MAKYKIISTLRFLNVNSSIEDEYTLMPGVHIINDKKAIENILDEEFQIVAGVLESNYLRNANHIIYCETEQSEVFGGLDSNNVLTVWLTWIEILLRDAWLLKDHSIICENAYCKVTDVNKEEWSSKSLNTPVSYSSGNKFQDVHFSLNELVDWSEKNYQIQTYLHEKKSPIYGSFVDKDFSRLGRSLRFINSARLDSHPALKIAHYCSALESLFSTDTSELTHKLSERVALFLKEFDYNAGEVFDRVKSYYGIRSTVMHGSSMKSKKAETLAQLSEDCDSLLRVIINIILNDTHIADVFEGPEIKFEKYFRTKLFPEPCL